MLGPSDTHVPFAMAITSEIYDSYGIPTSLRMHMLRVAGISCLLSDHWNGPPLNKEKLVRVLLVHDLGNMVKMEPERLDDVEFSDDQQRELFLAHRRSFLSSIGTDDHAVSGEIARRIGLSESERSLLDRKIFIRNDETLESDDYDLKVAAYADQRVAPFGVTGLAERLQEAKRRYREKPGSSMNNPRTDMLIDCALRIESQIISQTSLDREEVTESRVSIYIPSLLEYRF